MTRATIDRIVVLGFEVRVELTNAATQTPFTAQITRGDAEALGLQGGRHRLRPRHPGAVAAE